MVRKQIEDIEDDEELEEQDIEEEDEDDEEEPEEKHTEKKLTLVSDSQLIQLKLDELTKEVKNNGRYIYQIYKKKK